MDIEKIIGYHNEALNKQVEENPFLNQRLKTHLKTASPRRAFIVFPRLRKQAFLYATLFLLLTMVNFVVIGLIKKKPPQPQPNVITMDVFQPDFPGSISHIYQKVMP